MSFPLACSDIIATTRQRTLHFSPDVTVKTLNKHLYQELKYTRTYVEHNGSKIYF